MRKKSRYRKNPGAGDQIAARELALFTENDVDLYTRQARYIIVNLARKKKRGVYDAKKAVKLWMYLADAAAQKYTKMFDAPTYGSSYGIFTPATRRLAAIDLADSYAEELRETAHKLKKGERVKP
jgi:hypothetical protein